MIHTPRGERAAEVIRVGKASNELVSYSGDSISMYTHTGRHIVALNHFGYHGRIFDGFAVDEHLGSRA
jgi:kynurenine formamidase